jgi:hypothetical protein
METAMDMDMDMDTEMEIRVTFRFVSLFCFVSLLKYAILMWNETDPLCRFEAKRISLPFQACFRFNRRTNEANYFCALNRL